MSISKFDVKPFKFGQLVPTEGASESEQPLEEVSSFELKSLKDASAFKNNITDDVIRQERGFAREKSFSINPLVQEHRGLRAQEERDYEQAVEQEVQRRLSQAVEQAKEEGFQTGHQEGYTKAYQEAMAKLDDKVEDFVDTLNNLNEQCHKVLTENKQNAFEMIKNLTKWVSLKEVSDEGYLGRLLEKLILEINTKSNLVVRVSQESFKHMPEVIERVESKMGSLINVRVEVDLDQDAPGIILESENGIIDASMDAQMASLEKIFESVTVNE